METHNNLYWRIYRWFKWDAKHAPREIAQGFKNLWRWLPIVWKDRDWDDHFIFEPLKFKIKNTANYTEKKQRFVGWENEVRYMRICVKLIEHIQNDYYQSEYFDYFDFKGEFVPIEGSDNFEWKSNVTRDDISNYISKYPHTKRVVLSDEKLSNYRNTEKGLALAMGIVRHRKAKKLLFKILHDRIEYWWD